MKKEYKNYISFNNKLGYIFDLNAPVDVVNFSIKIISRFNKSYKTKKAIEAGTWSY